jgi:hypothetical protein
VGTDWTRAAMQAVLEGVSKYSVSRCSHCRIAQSSLSYAVSHDISTVTGGISERSARLGSGGFDRVALGPAIAVHWLGLAGGKRSERSAF